jgi:hypothetical protein
VKFICILTSKAGQRHNSSGYHWLPTAAVRFDPGSGQVGFVLDKVALWQVFSEYFGFSCQSSFHQLLHNHHHLSSGAGTIGQKWPQYKGLSPTPLAIKKNSKDGYIHNGTKQIACTDISSKEEVLQALCA